MVPDGPKMGEKWGTGGGQNWNGFLASGGSALSLTSQARPKTVNSKSLSALQIVSAHLDRLCDREGSKC